MNLNSKRIVVSFGKELGRCPVIEGEFPGHGDLDGVEKLRNIAILGWFRLTRRRIMTYGELESGQQYGMTPQAEAFFQLIRDMGELGADDLFKG